MLSKPDISDDTIVRRGKDSFGLRVAEATFLPSADINRAVYRVTTDDRVHAGNVLLGDNDKLAIVDWDNPIMAPKERDLMFVGGGIGDT